MHMHDYDDMLLFSTFYDYLQYHSNQMGLQLAQRVTSVDNANYSTVEEVMKRMKNKEIGFVLCIVPQKDDSNYGRCSLFIVN